MFTGPAEFYEADVARRKKLRPAIAHDGAKPVARQQTYRDILKVASDKTYTLKEVFEATRRAYGMSACEMIGPGRAYVYSRLRHAAWYVASRHTKASTTRMGAMWNRDHSTVVHGLHSVLERMDEYVDKIDAIERELFKGQ